MDWQNTLTYNFSEENLKDTRLDNTSKYRNSHFTS